MKKVRTVVGILFLMLLFAGCSEEPKETDKEFEEKTEREFEDDESAGNGFHYNLKEAAAYTIDGEDILVSYDGNPVVERYNENGEKTGEMDLGGELHTNLMVNGDCLFAVTFTGKGMQITEYNMKTEELIAHPLPSDMTSILSMAVTEQDIYLITWSDYVHSDEEGISGYDESDDYLYMGERAIVIPQDTYEIKDMPIQNVIALYQSTDSEVVYYAHDETDGFYFVTYDSEKKEFGEKVYNNAFGYTFGFAFDAEEDRVITANFSEQKLLLGHLNDNNAVADLEDQIVVMTGNDIKYRNGYCYVLDDLTRDVIRIELESVLVDNSEIVFYQMTDFDETYGCGYTIRAETLEEDEFALSVMAQNSQYDLCKVSTDVQVASEIREKGAFYALSDVPGVEEYLEACHPYIREAATDESGEVWMLPIDVQIPVLLYQEENCKEYGIDVEKLEGFKELVEVADRLYEKTELRDWYSLNGYQMRSNAIDKYNEGYIRRSGEVEYDMPVFRELCELFKEYRPGERESLHTWMTQITALGGDEDEYYGKYLLNLAYFWEFAGSDERIYTELRARALPEVGDEQTPNYGTCTYLSVNPNSENLENTLDYISAYCSYMMGRKDTYLFQEERMPYPDTPLSKDLHEIYKNGGISFWIPENIFWDDYLSYQENELSLDELVEELNRKVSMYLNE